MVDFQGLNTGELQLDQHLTGNTGAGDRAEVSVGTCASEYGFAAQPAAWSRVAIAQINSVQTLAQSLRTLPQGLDYSVYSAKVILEITSNLCELHS